MCAVCQPVCEKKDDCAHSPPYFVFHLPPRQQRRDILDRPTRLHSHLPTSIVTTYALNSHAHFPFHLHTPMLCKGITICLLCAIVAAIVFTYSFACLYQMTRLGFSSSAAVCSVKSFPLDFSFRGWKTAPGASSRTTCPPSRAELQRPAGCYGNRDLPESNAPR